MLKVYLLGTFRLDHGGEYNLAVQTSRLQTLLAYLLLHDRGPIARQQLAFVFWPDSSEAQARANLRGLVRRLREALPDHEHLLLVTDQRLQWRHEGCWVDVVALRHAL